MCFDGIIGINEEISTKNSPLKNGASNSLDNLKEPLQSLI